MAMIAKVNIKQMRNIIKYSNPKRAQMYEGIHGIGKSEIITSICKELGYDTKTLFLGQMADTGDLIGLPFHSKKKTGNKIPVKTLKESSKNVPEEKRTDKDYETIYEDETITTTDFAPPQWWPTNPDKPFALILDEMNRSKPECLQCIMDMVLNGKLNGKVLPKNFRIFALVNPLDDEYYDVVELDPALLDRFRRYEFSPTHEEWLDHAMRVGYHKLVIGFIGKNYDMLDPITKTDGGSKKNDVQPSRRSWEQVSKNLKLFPELEKNQELLLTLIEGDVGSSACSRFKKFLREQSKSLRANTIIMKWSKDVAKELDTFELQDYAYMNRQVAFWFQEYEETLKVDKVFSAQAMKGLAKYLKAIGNEPMAQFLNILATDNFDGKSYAKTMLHLNPDLAEGYFDMLHGKEEEEKNPELETEPEI